MQQVIRIICFCTCSNEGFVTDSVLAASTGNKRIRTVSTIGRFVTLFIRGEMTIQLPGNTQREENAGILSYQRLQSDEMADNTRLVLIAVDDCDHSEKAFDCKQGIFVCNQCLLTLLKIAIANILPLDNFVPMTVKMILFVFLLALVQFLPRRRSYFILVISLQKSLNGKKL